jgi:protein-disulfide isomerase
VTTVIDLPRVILPLSRISRRAVGFAVLAAVMGATLPASAQKKKEAPAEVPVEELMKPGALPDLVMGKADAPITIVEYASQTCGHCGNFHTKVLPDLKKKYIDTGKVKLVYREFPLDNLSAAASMLARCAGGDKTLPLASILYAKQEEWAFTRNNPVPELFKFAKQAGFTQESFDKCLTDQKLLDELTAGRERAAEKFGVSGTPAFFINGKRFTDAPTMDAFDKAIAAAEKK